MINEKSCNSDHIFILYSANLNESLQTKISLFQSASCFDFIRTQVNTGLKLFSVTANSTFFIPFENVIPSNDITLSLGTSGNATYSLDGIQFISKLSLADLIVMMFDFGSTFISIFFSSIVLMISENVFALTVIVHSNHTIQGISISMYFSISVALIINESMEALKYMFCRIGNVAFFDTNLMAISINSFNLAVSSVIFMAV